MRLDVPSQRPRNPDIALPFCSEVPALMHSPQIEKSNILNVMSWSLQYQSCTCCNASHAVAIRRTLVSVLKDKGMSSSCKQLSKQFACRVCDPWVWPVPEHHSVSRLATPELPHNFDLNFHRIYLAGWCGSKARCLYGNVR